MNATRNALMVVALGVLVLASRSNGDVLDDIKNLTRAAAVRATEARDRASEARDRATEVRDSAAAIRDDLREGLAKLSDEMRTTVDEAAEDLQRLVLETTAGREDFVADGGCSMAVCEPFRQDLISLFQNTQDLLNLLYDIAGMQDMGVDFQRLIHLIETIPGRALFPVYQVMGQGGNVLSGGLLERLSQSAGDLRAIRDASHTAILLSAKRGTETTRLESELDRCQPLAETLEERRQRSSRLTETALALKSIGKLLVATGTIEVSWVAGFVWFEMGYKTNWRKGTGLLLDKIAEVLFWYANDYAEDTRYCTQIVTRGELRDALADPACEDDDPKTECEIEADEDDPGSWSMASGLRDHPQHGQIVILQKQREIRENQAVILEAVHRLREGDLDNDGDVDLQDYATMQAGFGGP